MVDTRHEDEHEEGKRLGKMPRLQPVKLRMDSNFSLDCRVPLNILYRARLLIVSRSADV